MEKFFQENIWLFALLALWTVLWKGWALWKSARLNDQKWFVALLIFQTLAILDIIYIFIFSKRKI